MSNLSLNPSDKRSGSAHVMHSMFLNSYILVYEESFADQLVRERLHHAHACVIPYLTRLNVFQGGAYLYENKNKYRIFYQKIPKSNLENGSFRNRENILYTKTADSVLLSLFMRTNGKCNNSHAP